MLKKQSRSTIFYKETEVFKIQDGKTFNLDDPYDRNVWEAIKNCKFIAPDRYAKDENGDYLIDGTMNWSLKTTLQEQLNYILIDLVQKQPRKIIRKKKYIPILTLYLLDDRGVEGRLLIARLLGKNMKNLPDADVEDYLLQGSRKESR